EDSITMYLDYRNEDYGAELFGFVQSLIDRGIISPELYKTDPGEARDEINRYYDNIALKMRDQWPSPKEQNYGGEKEGQGKVIYFKGFKARSFSRLCSGPYTELPTYVKNLVYYDEDGIGRQLNTIAVCATEALGQKDPRNENYLAIPYLAFSTTLKDRDAMAAIDRWIAYENKPPLYDGYANNCVAV